MTQYHKFTALLLATALTACATPQENPFYQHSTQYKGDTPTTSYANYQQPSTTYATTQHVSANNTVTNHECLRQETNRELIGGAIGGTVGAFAGKELIGGTKGTVIGAAIGGTAGYGIGDKTINCDPLPVSASTQQYQTQNASFQAIPASTQPYACPAGTTAQPNGTCMMGEQAAPTYTASVPATTMSAPTGGQYGGQSATGTPGYMAVQNSLEPSPVMTPSVVTSSGSQAVDYDYSQNMVNANAPATFAPQEETRVLSGNFGNYQVQQGDTVYSLSRKLCVSVSDIQSTNGLGTNYGIQIGQTLQLPSSRC